MADDEDDGQGFDRTPKSVLAAESAALAFEEWRASQKTALAALLFGHAAGAAAHMAAAITTLTTARFDVHVTVNRVKNYIAQNNTAAAAAGDVIAVPEPFFALHPSWLIFIFFVLSFAAHAIEGLSMALDLCVHKRNSVSLWAEWYIYSLYRCCVPSRWTEYFFSASIMVLLFALLTAVRGAGYLLALTTLMATTQLFGLAGEMLSALLVVGEKRERSWKSNTLFYRLVPWLLGWVPYSACWLIIASIAVENVETLGVQNPSFVISLLGAQITLFSCFGITQLVNIVAPNGPSWFVWGEFSYVVLSFSAKVNFGIVAITEVLGPNGKYDREIGLKLD
jgi:hypothetical protein